MAANPIPEPQPDSVIEWAVENPEAPRDAVRAVNKLMALRVVIRTSGTSSLLIGDNEATLTISTKDIQLGTISGSRGSNAALASVIDSLARTFTITNSTTA